MRRIGTVPQTGSTLRRIERRRLPEEALGTDHQLLSWPPERRTDTVPAKSRLGADAGARAGFLICQRQK